MKEVLKFHEDRSFEVPRGVVFRDVDRRTGLLASGACPDSVHEAFLAGTEPMVTCDGEQIQGIPPPPQGEERKLDWFERLFRGR
jgi:membrane carboxypeptidase/penicillin-binding protein